MFYIRGVVEEVAGNRCVICTHGKAEGRTVLLDGSVDTIFAANELAGLVLTRDTVVAYLRFFCSAMDIGEPGNRALVLNTADGVTFEAGWRPIGFEVFSPDEMFPCFRVDAYSAFEGEVYDTRFEVESDTGKVLIAWSTLCGTYDAAAPFAGSVRS